MPNSDTLNGSAPAPLELSRDVARRYLEAQGRRTAGPSEKGP
jgi:hypothetical protein